MKTLRFNIACIVALLAVGSVSAAVNQEFERKIIEEFQITSDGEVELSNKYGAVTVETWNESRVKIEVTIKVDAGNQDKANDVFDRVSINFSNTSSLVRAATEIETSKKWNSWWNGGSNKFEINYKVYLPGTASVDIDNKYGDVLLASVEGDAEVVLKYGNLRIDEIGGNLRVDLGYGKGTVNGCAAMDLDMKYSTLKCGDIGDLDAVTKYSSLEAESAGVIQSTSSYDGYKFGSATSLSNVGKYDDFDLGDIESVIISTKYSNLEVMNLGDKADLDFKNGNIKIRNVRAGFSFIDVVSDYAGISVGVESGAQFTFEATGKYGSVKVNDVEVYHDIRTNNSTEVRGFRGARDASSWIKATMSYGSIKIN